MRELIRRDQERQRPHALLLERAESPVSSKADAGYFETLRARARAGKTLRRRA